MNIYFEEQGGVRMKHDLPVENGLLFRARLEVVRRHYYASGKMHFIHPIPIFETLKNHRESEQRFRGNPPKSDSHFSHDDMKGYYILCYMFEKDLLSTLPIFRWNNRKGTDSITTWWHPNGWMVFLSLRSQFLAWVFHPFIALMIWWSVRDYFKSNMKDTSGLCLWLDLLPLLAQQCSLYENLWASEGYYLPKIIAPKCYDTYCSNDGNYDNEDHPIRVLL